MLRANDETLAPRLEPAQELMIVEASVHHPKQSADALRSKRLRNLLDGLTVLVIDANKARCLPGEARLVQEGALAAFADAQHREGMKAWDGIALQVTDGV